MTAPHELLAAAALHRETPGVAATTLPHELHICPAGPVVEGQDGSRFRVEDPEAVIAASPLPSMLDADHASFLTGDTRAYGWVDRIEYHAEARGSRAPGFWAHVESWTAKGAELVSDKVYRYLSPAVRYHHRKGESPKGLPVLRSFVNFGLTNRPNLTMTMLHSFHGTKGAPVALPGAPRPADGGHVSAEIRQIRAEALVSARLDAMVQTHARRGAIPECFSEHVRILAERDPIGVAEALQATPSGEAERLAFCQRFGLPYTGGPELSKVIASHGLSAEQVFSRPARRAADQAQYEAFCQRFGFEPRPAVEFWK